MIAAGRAEHCPPLQELKGNKKLHGELSLIEQIGTSAKDALLQQPRGSYEKICELTAKLNAFHTIEVLLRTSRVIWDCVSAEHILLVAAYFDVGTGKVSFLGEHPSKRVCPPSPAPPPTRATGARHTSMRMSAFASWATRHSHSRLPLHAACTLIAHRS